MMRRVLLWASENDFLRERLPRRRFVQRAVRRFMPGETLDEALAAARQLDAGGVGTVLTLLGENVTEPSEAGAVVQHYLAALDAVAKRGVDAEISVKLTQLGLDVDRELALSNLLTLANHAAEHDNFVWVDVESSSYVDVTIDIYRTAHAAHSNTGLCLQAYLYRTQADLEALLPLSPAIRLVKGAYAEPPSVAYPRKADVDANFFHLAERLIEARLADPAVRPAIATHDAGLIQRIRDTAARRGLAPDGYEIQMLYGIRREEQERLAASDAQLRVLVSYGEAWYPWYVRRLAERPANVWFVLKNLFAR